MQVDVIDEVAFDRLSSDGQLEVVALSDSALEGRLQRLTESDTNLTCSRISIRERASPPTPMAQTPRIP